MKTIQRRYLTEAEHELFADCASVVRGEWRAFTPGLYDGPGALWLQRLGDGWVAGSRSYAHTNVRMPTPREALLELLDCLQRQARNQVEDFAMFVNPLQDAGRA